MKEKIKQTIEECLKQATSQKEFLNLLQNHDFIHYERTVGQPTGIVFENNKYRFTRLGIDIAKLESLPLDLTEEEKTLKEIQSIREQQNEPTRNRILRFEEQSIEKVVEFNYQTKKEIWQDKEGFVHEEQTELTPEEFKHLDNMHYYSELSEKEIEEMEQVNNSKDYNLDDLFEFEEPER